MNSGIVQKIFLDHFDRYRSTRDLSNRQLKAASSIMTCRRPEQGYHIDACPSGDYEVKKYNSCKHRSCPQCGATETQLWLERRKRQALDCRYFHIVFTISHDLHRVWRPNRKRFTRRMIRAAWRSIRELLLDWRWLGGLPGGVGVFQSWDDEMKEHCHLHFILTAGGLNLDGRWVKADKEFLLPTPVLAKKFRGKFLAYLKEDLLDRQLKLPQGMSLQKCLNLINKLGRVRWHADIEPSYEHANGVFKYVGRYIRRGPISEKRIIGYDGENVKIAYAHREKHDRPCFTLKADEFIDRLLRHVPVKGTHLVRACGLFHPNCRVKLDIARAQLDQPPYQPIIRLPNAHELIRRMFPNLEGTRCPICGSGLKTVYVCRRGRSPTWRAAA